MRTEQAHFWHAAALHTSFDALNATYITHTFAKHTHEGYAIALIERGHEAFYYRGQVHVATVGEIIVINPGENHTGNAIHDQGWTYRVIYPGTDLLVRVAQQACGWTGQVPFFGGPIFRDVEVFERLHQAHQALENSPSALERESRLISGLALLIGRHADHHIRYAPRLSPDDRHLQQAQDYLEQHYAEDVSLERLAQLVHLSPYHLSRLFHARLGLPPHAYLNQVRVRHARRLLAQRLPIAEIALAVGFADQSHLTKAFKRIVGVSPGQYSRSAE